MMTKSTERYITTLRYLLQMPTDSSVIAYEWLGAYMVFTPEPLDCIAHKYVEHELDWYKSQDLCIVGHPGIENNSIWERISTEKGMVNSNYGWCIYSKDNFLQFEKACNAIIEDNNTKHAVMIYTRPSINTEWCDGVHAKSDMICTVYTAAFLRNNKLQYHVHMRSNDAVFGMRNDFMWHLFVQKQMVEYLNKRHVQCVPGDIHWFADSLHIYKSSISKVQDLIKVYG